MPQLQPVEWKKDRKEMFRGWFADQLGNTDGDRGSLESKWQNELISWRARVVGDGIGDVPFIGASDIDMPLIGMHTDPVYADFMQTLHATDNFFSVTPLRADATEVAKPLQEFLKHLDNTHIHMRSVNGKVLFDMIIHGTGIYKSDILHQRKKTKGYNDQGDVEDNVDIKFTPRVRWVPLSDFYIPAAASEIDPDAPVRPAQWVAERFYLTEGQFNLRKDSESPFLPAYDKNEAREVSTFLSDQRDDDTLETQRSEDRYQPWQDIKIRLFEVWCRYDVDGDGIEEDIVIVWHHGTNSILRATHNPFMHGKRPYNSVRYLPAGGFYGMGMAELDEWAQLTASRLMNSMVDSATLSNTIMISAPLGANLNADEAFYPGKIWATAPGERIEPINMGQPNGAINTAINSFLQWSELRTSVSDLRQGDISSLPSRTPAITTQNILAEGNKRFDMILANARVDALNPIGTMLVQNLIQITQDDQRWIAEAVQVLGEKDGALVAEVLSGKIGEVEMMFGVNVTATSSAVNKEKQKQDTIFLSQQLGQVYPQLMQYAQMMGDQQLMASVVQAAFAGTIELGKVLLESHDIQNTDIFLPALPPPQPQGQPQQQPGAQQGTPAEFDPGGGLGGPGGSGALAQGPAQIAQLLGLG